MVLARAFPRTIGTDADIFVVDARGTDVLNNAHAVDLFDIVDSAVAVVVLSVADFGAIRIATAVVNDAVAVVIETIARFNLRRGDADKVIGDTVHMAVATAEAGVAYISTIRNIVDDAVAVVIDAVADLLVVRICDGVVVVAVICEAVTR